MNKIIEIDGVKYDLNIEKALENKNLVEIVNHARGNVYVFNCDKVYVWATNGEKYILATPDYNHIQLICLNDGDRWTSMVKVVDAHNITSADWALVTGGNEDFFKLIKS